jgi:hypothetical protein
MVVEKDKQDVQNRIIKGFPTLRCDCDAPQVISPQMESFPSWEQLQVFFQSFYGLNSRGLRVFE